MLESKIFTEIKTKNKLNSLQNHVGGATRAEAIDPVVDPVDPVDPVADPVADPVDPVNPIFYFLFYFLNKMKFNHNHKLRMKR